MVEVCTHFLLSVLLAGINCAVEFDYDTEQQCLDQSVEYQCTVTGTGFYALRWRIYDNNGTQIATTAYTSDVVGDSTPIGEEQFIVEQLPPPSPIVSNISFTVQSSISGYTVHCEESGTTDFVDLTINIPDIPPRPESVTIHTDTFTSSSVSISWTESSSPCVTGYRYNVSSKAIEENIIMESTSNSAVMVEGLVPSGDQYCVVVTAIDTANRNSGDDSDPACYIFSVPPDPVITSIANETESDTTDRIIINWKPLDYNVGSDIATPDSTFILTIKSNGDFEKSSGQLPHGTTGYTFCGIPKGVNYTIELVATNGIGSSVTVTYYYGGFVSGTSTTSLTVFATKSSSVSLKLTSTSTIISTSASISSCTTETITMTYPVDNADRLSSPVAAGISVAIAVPITAVITAIITVIIMYLCTTRHNNSKQSWTPPPQEYETPSTGLEMKSNAAYGQVNCSDKPIDKQPTTTTTMMYETVYT